MEGSCIAHYPGGLFPRVPWVAVQLGGEVCLALVALWWYGASRALRAAPLPRAA
jgi:hypothetical protein